MSKRIVENQGRVYELPSEQQNTKQLWSVYLDKKLISNIPTAFFKQQELPWNLQDKVPKPVQFYRDNYNLVDLFNRNFYKNRWPHKAKTIENVIFDGIFHIIVLNTWVIYTNIKKSDIDMQSFMDILSKKLLN